MKVLICGSREWVDQGSIEREMRKLPKGTIIVHGACRGADNIAGWVGERLGFEVRSFPADWDKYGRGAGNIRNQQMLDEEHREDEPIDLVWGFHKDPGLGKGTKDMRDRTVAAGIQFVWFSK